MEEKVRAKARVGLGLSSAISTLVLAFLEPEFAKAFLSAAWHTWLVQCLIVLAVVWFSMGNRIKKVVQDLVHQALDQFTGHFDRMEKAVDKVAQTVTHLEDTVSKGFAVHSERIGGLEEKVSDLGSRVSVLETKPKEGQT